ncbi:FtsX-like permease family protein [Streptomyces tibetensis]|uniref:FtsX-like permease family protein n=1 Tax=Streptomyces tibetensis TaxID=2382123 RepID=UPI0038294208
MLDSALAGRLDVRVGGTVRLTGPDGLRPYQVSGIADPPRKPARQYAVFHTPREAERLADSAQPRRREFTLLRIAGAQSAQVLRMLAWEAVLTCAVALLLAAVVCGAVLVPLSVALTGSVVPALAGGPLTALAAGALVLTVATVTLAGLLALRSSAATPGGLTKAVS